jgi:N-acetylmuramoyl-L-alanine amidase
MGDKIVKIIEKYLSINQYSRSGRGLVCCKAVILHYVGIPAQRAITTWNFFEKTCPEDKHYSSVHYIIDLNGDIYHAVPDNEIAFHCGSAAVDPVSKRIYTDWARQKFGYYASDPVKISPNFCTIGIELCINANGIFTPETIKAAVELVAKLVEKNKLSVDDIGTHQQIVGWKDCPLPWVKELVLLEEFKDAVRTKLGVLI